MRRLRQAPSLTLPRKRGREGRGFIYRTPDDL
jgi:hypothetical protein